MAKLMYLALRNIVRGWKILALNWPAAMNPFAIVFGERFFAPGQAPEPKQQKPSPTQAQTSGHYPRFMKTTHQERRSTLVTLLLATTLAVTLAGCDKKPQAPGNPPAPTANTASTPVAEPVLTAWQQGDQAGAISRFLETDWSKRPLFAPGTTLSLSEEQFMALPVSDREAKSKALLPQLADLKALAQAVAQAGRDAAAKKDLALAKKHFTALQQFGAAIDTPESMQIVRLVGRAVKKMGDAELVKLGQ